MYKPIEVTDINGATENINLSQVVKSFDNQTEDHGTVLVIEFSNGSNTVLNEDQREIFIAADNVYKEAVRVELWTLAQNIDQMARQQAKNAPKPPRT
jgi:frataxin-like iron-binding protein CyaY